MTAHSHRGTPSHRRRLPTPAGSGRPCAVDAHGRISEVAGVYAAGASPAGRAPGKLGAEPLHDRTPAAGSAAAGDRDEAFHLALLLAEEDARLGDYRQALHALDAAAALAGGVLPKEWSESRARWQRELTPQRPPRGR